MRIALVWPTVMSHCTTSKGFFMPNEENSNNVFDATKMNAHSNEGKQIGGVLEIVESVSCIISRVYTPYC